MWRSVKRAGVIVCAFCLAVLPSCLPQLKPLVGVAVTAALTELAGCAAPIASPGSRQGDTLETGPVDQTAHQTANPHQSVSQTANPVLNVGTINPPATAPAGGSLLPP